MNLKVKNKVGDSAELYIYGDIIDNTDWKWDDFEVMPDDVKNILNEIEGINNLNIYINSGGGSVFAGMAIYNMLKRYKGHKTVYVDGIAASIASVIALAGDKVVVPSNAYFMIHKAWTFGFGNSDDMLKLAETLEKIDEGILNVYKENLKDGVEIETIQQMVEAETWFTGEEAASYFNIDVTETVNVAASASDYYEKYRKTPDKLQAEEIKEEDDPFIDNETEKQRLLLELDLI